MSSNSFDKFIKNSIQNYTKAPPESIWAGVKSGVLIKKVLAFKFIAGSQALSILSTIAGAGIIASAIVFSPLKNKNTPTEISATQQEKQIQEQIDNNETIETTAQVLIDQEPVTNYEKLHIDAKPESISLNSSHKTKTTKLQNTTSSQNEPAKKTNQINYQEPTNLIKQSKDIVQNNTTLKTTGLVFSKTDIEKIQLLSPTIYLKKPNKSNIDHQPVHIKNYFSLAMWESPNYVVSNLINQSSDNIIYDHKLKAEKPKTFYSRGVELTYQPKNISITTGLNYNIVGEQASYDYSFEEYDSIGYNIIARVTLKWYVYWDRKKNKYDSVLRAIYKYDFQTLYDTTKVIQQKSTTNQYKYFEIPVLIGYHIGFNKFMVGLEGGVSGGRLSSSIGMQPTSVENVFNSLENQPEILNKYSLNGILRLKFSYSLSYRFSILVAPSLRYSFTSTFNKQYPISQQYRSYGLNTGLIYRF